MRVSLIGAYAAGLFDGEGHICIDKGMGKRYGPYPYLVIGITSACRAVLDWLYDNFGGRIHSKHRKSETKRPCWVWRTSGDSALQFLRSVKEFVITKAQVVELGIKFQETKNQTSTEEKMKLREQIMSLTFGRKYAS